MTEQSGRPVLFGEVLFDCFPDGARVLGGAPFNVAWHLRGFGLDPLMISRVGEDEAGREILDAMESWGLDTAGIQRDRDHATGEVRVSLDDGEPTFDILTDRAFDFIAAGDLPDVADGALLYHGSLAARGPESRAALETLVRSGLPRYVDVNLRAPYWDEDSVLGLLEGARFVKLNGYELGRLPGAGEGAELTLITRGRRGARAVAKGGEVSEVEPPPDQDVVDTVGAGDGFASVTILGVLAGWPVATLLERAQEFANGIVGLRGATTQDRAFYDRYRNRWRLE